MENGFTARRPAAAEYAEYYGRYVDQVADGPILRTLSKQLADSLALFAPVDEKSSMHRYAPGKWSVKEVVGHVTDVERVFACRALHFARGERQPIPGIDQDEYVAAAGFDARPFEEIVAEFEAVRRSTVAMLSGFAEDAWGRRGTASGCEFTVRSIPWILAGHELHHAGVLRQRYLAGGS